MRCPVGMKTGTEALGGGTAYGKLHFGPARLVIHAETELHRLARVAKLLDVRNLAPGQGTLDDSCAGFVADLQLALGRTFAVGFRLPGRGGLRRQV